MRNKGQPTRDITVEGEKYVVQFYDPEFGTELFASLLRLLGVPAIRIFAGLKGKKLSEIVQMDMEDFDLNVMAEALSSLFAQMPDKELAPFLQRILSQTFFGVSKDCVCDDFRENFRGSYLHLFKLVGATLGVQYADFLSGMRRGSSALKKEPASEKNPKRSEN